MVLNQQKTYYHTVADLNILILGMLASLGLLFYRIVCLSIYGYAAYFIFEDRHPKISLATNINLQTRFLTVDTLVRSFLHPYIVLAGACVILCTCYSSYANEI